jgi:hypothetical protein
MTLIPFAASRSDTFSQPAALHPRSGQPARSGSQHERGGAANVGVSEALLNEALWLLSFPGDKRISFPAKDRVALGPEWLERCEGQTPREKPHR